MKIESESEEEEEEEEEDFMDTDSESEESGDEQGSFFVFCFSFSFSLIFFLWFQNNFSFLSFLVEVQELLEIIQNLKQQVNFKFSLLFLSFINFDINLKS